MDKVEKSGKRLQISKANAVMVGSLAIASFILVFTLVAGRALLSQRAFQQRVIDEKQKTDAQLDSNLEEVSKLVEKYQAFASAPTNVLGGNGSPTAAGESDGDNARIVLDALPSKYDFPALASSLEKILNSGGYKIEAISGSDDELAQAANQSSSDPKPIAIPFSIAIAANYASIQNFVSVLEKSIRPVQIQTLNLTQSDNGLRLAITAKTSFQPSKNLDIRTKEVK